MRDLICVICEGDGNFELKWTSGGRYWRAPIYCTQRWRDNFVYWNKTGKLFVGGINLQFCLPLFCQSYKICKQYCVITLPAFSKSTVLPISKLLFWYELICFVLQKWMSNRYVLLIWEAK